MKAPRPRQKRWVVREGDGTTVAEIVKRAGEDLRAVAEGRVFVGRVRVAAGTHRVKVGDEVKIGGAEAAAGARSGTGTGMRTGGAADWEVIWERDGMLACNKPAGIPTVADHVGASHALVALAAEAIGRTASELFVTSRLDREVSGVVIFATSREAESRLRLARAAGQYERRYVAIAEDQENRRQATGDRQENRRQATGNRRQAMPRGDERQENRRQATGDRRQAMPRRDERRQEMPRGDDRQQAMPSRAAGPCLVSPIACRLSPVACRLFPSPFLWDAPIGAGGDPRHRAAFGGDAKAAQTRGRVVARAGRFVMLAVAPQTGRTHQIRVHASHAGLPLLGDRDYGGSTRVTLDDGRVVALARIALHAARVKVPAASGDELLIAEAPIPSALTRAWAELGGEPEAWNTAVSCELDT